MPAARAHGVPRLARLGRAARGRRADRPESLRRRASQRSVRRSDQHPVHERHHRLREGRHAHPPQHPQQRLLRRRGVPLSPRGPGLHPGAVLPLLRHGDGQPRLHHARRVHGRSPPRRSSPARRSRRCRTSAARRCYGVPTMFIAELDHPDFDSFDLSSLRTGIMAGSPCPVEVMRKVIDRMHMERGDDLLRHDRDLAGFDSDGADDDARPPRLHRRTGAPARRGQDRRPGTGTCLPRGASGELCTRGYSVMLGYWDEPEKTARGDRRGRLDAHGRPRHDGRRRLRQDRRPLQGHDHPRRREHLSARDRGVPLHAPRRRRRAGRRCPRRALRRGDRRVRDRARRGPRSTSRRCASSAAAGSRTSRSRATSSRWTSSR